MSDRPKVILLVEDDNDIRSIFRRVLEMKGYEVVEASDGIEALKTLENDKKIAGVILDLFMPIMDGHEFLLTLRGQYDHVDPNLPVIIVSAAPPDSDIAQNATQLSQGFLRKPVKMKDLTHILEQTLDKHL